MAQRHEAADSVDDFPTPPWATRALIEHVIGRPDAAGKICMEPACGRGYMAEPLRSYFADVLASDIVDYGYGEVADFLNVEKQGNVDWVITNPPFRLAEDFFHRAHTLANVGVALLVRTVFLEGKGRLERVFSKFPPTLVAQFSERVPMVRGRLDRKASTATGYAWVVWQKPLCTDTRLTWIPPCRKQFEQDADYQSTNVNSRDNPHQAKRPALDLLSGL